MCYLYAKNLVLWNSAIKKISQFIVRSCKYVLKSLKTPIEINK